MSEILVLITTELNEKIGRDLAKLLIQNKLAVCVSIKPIYSLYAWEGDIAENNEVEITIKSKPDLKDDLVRFLQKMTSYDVPQILYKKFHSDKKYHDWITNTI